MAQVYVSYGGKDRRTALPVIEAMRQAGLDVCPHDIAAGGSFLEQTRRELDKAQCVVVLWSKAAAQSVFLQQEIHHAIQAWSSDRLVLAALDDTPLPVGLRDLSPISIREASDSGTKQLIERVARAIVGRASVAVESRLDVRSKRARAEGEVRRAAQQSREAAQEALRAKEEEVRRAAEAARRAEEVAAERARRAALGTTPRSHVGRISAAAPLAGIVVLGAAAAIFSTQTEYWDSGTLSDQTLEERGRGGGIRIPKPNLPFDLTMLALGAATGAGATWACIACIVWLRRRSNRASTTMLVQLPAASDGVRVFVSHSRHDGQTVEQLVRQIGELGYAVWIDRQSSSAQRYAASIVAAIRASRVVALMCSQNAFTSDHVIREVYVAGDYKKPFIVFQLDSTGLPDEILYFVSGFPRLPVATVDQQELRSEIARLLAA
jgi:TIR domain